MRAAIVVTDPSDWTAQSLLASFYRMGIVADLLNFEDLMAFINGPAKFRCAGLDLEELDAILVRDLGRSGTSDVAFRFETLMALQERGVDVINPPPAIARAANKFATSLALQRAGVPTPRTAVTTSMEEAQAVLQNLGRAVSKPLFGFKGREIFLLQDGVQADLARLESILNMEGMVYLQEFIALESPRDIRAFVVDGAVLGAIYRLAPPGQWISNLARGGHPAACPLAPELVDLAGRAAEAVGAVYCGVDLLETDAGLSVIEVNGTPSAKGIFQALGLDATEAIAEHVYQNCYLRGR
ncbi:MAG TPA: RimK family alpha-L-glutamate ligase [Methanothrix sp.]|mgnify:FL=1|jgi:tetrahydromethanopterin:alpha-L-glutamate ligase|nr:RimK family alpha-L-glutamate ligase [Methanothrix sp.]HOU69799.1 RimK family alpha-L-glutamate ligase [Methanothrix sp.]HQE97701.1 RimK family alpha-L-glutamate ligase [Methanothrix sp.]HQJ78894.1 RimK family alpha-L-glutamate ligase [Methanothrix sp.]